ncbi:hypothetical protein POM88_005812 [Heracleum sosnowskyi]|uniref:Uncharacterized protein n=1 Tax=Heracleum sosnowskyi TaxID=360622 RepID=A0AAD8J1H0_9APIA|nr:hypothetical protein POM88_005812 [Heracleum sosnowskyi]
MPAGNLQDASRMPAGNLSLQHNLKYEAIAYCTTSLQQDSRRNNGERCEDKEVEFADGSCLQGLVFCGDGSQSGVRTIPCDSMESSSIMNFTASLNADTREALAICIKQKEACHHSLGSLERMQLELGIFPLTALGDRGEHDQWVETMMKYATASGSYLDKEASKNFVARYRSYEQVAWDVGTEVVVDSLEEKTVVHIDFAVGDIVEKVTRTPNKKVFRPVTGSFCAQLVANVQAATVEKNKKQRVIVGDGALEVKPRAATVPKLGEGGFGSVVYNST